MNIEELIELLQKLPRDFEIAIKVNNRLRNIKDIYVDMLGEIVIFTGEK